MPSISFLKNLGVLLTAGSSYAAARERRKTAES